MKIAQYQVRTASATASAFIKGEDRSVLSEAWDRIYVTTCLVRISQDRRDDESRCRSRMVKPKQYLLEALRAS